MEVEITQIGPSLSSSPHSRYHSPLSWNISGGLVSIWFITTLCEIPICSWVVIIFKLFWNILHHLSVMKVWDSLFWAACFEQRWLFWLLTTVSSLGQLFCSGAPLDLSQSQAAFPVHVITHWVGYRILIAIDSPLGFQHFSPSILSHNLKSTGIK